MKKFIFVVVPMAILFAGCSSPSEKKDSLTKDSHTSSSVKQVAKDSNKQPNSGKDLKDSSISGSTSDSSQVNSSTASSSVNSSNSSFSNESDSLKGYSDEQIEYARVWLATMGDTYKTWLSDPNVGFELNVHKEPAGTATNPYATDSATFPFETVFLSGKFGYQSLVVYSSNHDGSITLYPVPSHFHGENTKEESQKILDNASYLRIPTGNPDDVKQLIDVMKINN